MKHTLNAEAVTARDLLRYGTLAAALCVGAAPYCSAEDWGAYSIVPVSAPGMVLEVTEAVPRDGALISIGRPAGTVNQKWTIIPKDGEWFMIQCASEPSLVLSVENGGGKNGTSIILEKEKGKPWQQWSLTKSEGGSYNLTPRHAPGMGLDDQGGKQNPGAKIDLWQNSGKDQHLQWMIKPLAGSTAQTAKSEALGAPYQPPAVKPESVLAGTIKQFTFSESKVFPGTVREVTVFVPAQYDGAKPACVYVKTDGYNPKEKALMETMIATGEMPVTVGVFVRPGELPAPLKGTLGRRNRDLEYDGVGDENVRFLTDELLPFIAKEFGLNLSTDGKDRCMSGGSSGGIAEPSA
ncbi:MAG: RICIN domain-containing protein [Verrucomicrobiota bacterium]